MNNPLLGKLTTLRRLASGSIPPNEPVRLSYDFLMNILPNVNETRSLSEPAVLDIFHDHLVEPTMTYLNPEYVFIGMDEIRGMNRDSRNGIRDNSEVLGGFLNAVHDQLTSYNPNIKVLVWDDMINPFHNGGVLNYQVIYGGKPGRFSDALPTLRPNFIPVAWHYNEFGSRHKVRASPPLYNHYGFDFMMGPSAATCRGDRDQTARWAAQSGLAYGALGVVEHEFGNNFTGVPRTADYGWNVPKPSGSSCQAGDIELCNGRDDDCDDLYSRDGVTQETWLGGSIDEGFKLDSDTFNCGACGVICDYPNGIARCVERECELDRCLPGYSDIDGDPSNGCEPLV